MVKKRISKKPKAIGRPTRRKRSASSIDYKSGLLERLRDLDYAAGYLTSCYQEGIEVFLLAISDVAEAQGGMRALAAKTSLNRENLYDMLSPEGNPRLTSLSSILDTLGMNISFKRKMQGTKAA